MPPRRERTNPREVTFPPERNDPSSSRRWTAGLHGTFTPDTTSNRARALAFLNTAQVMSRGESTSGSDASGFATPTLRDYPSVPTESRLRDLPSVPTIAPSEAMSLTSMLDNMNVAIGNPDTIDNIISDIRIMRDNNSKGFKYFISTLREKSSTDERFKNLAESLIIDVEHLTNMLNVMNGAIEDQYCTEVSRNNIISDLRITRDNDPEGFHYIVSTLQQGARTDPSVKRLEGLANSIATEGPSSEPTQERNFRIVKGTVDGMKYTMDSQDCSRAGGKSVAATIRLVRRNTECFAIMEGMLQAKPSDNRSWNHIRYIMEQMKSEFSKRKDGILQGISNYADTQGHSDRIGDLHALKVEISYLKENDPEGFDNIDTIVQYKATMRESWGAVKDMIIDPIKRGGNPR